MDARHAEPAGGRAYDLFLAREGYGPLLQRDYWCVIKGCQLAPSQLMRVVARNFEHFAPAEFATFQKPRPGVALEVGDELGIRLLGAGRARVRVIHMDAQSFTLATLAGHPEAGRITFGAYRNPRGDVVFHIRSRARSGSRLRYYGFLGAGEPMQTRVWTDFVNRVAVATGQGVVGWIQSETRPCGDEPEEQARAAPTYLARGD
jgi:hypothetical protein